MTPRTLGRVLRFALLAQLLVLAIGTSGATGARVGGPYYPSGSTSPSWLHFSEPAVGGEDKSLLDELTRMIHSTGPGDFVGLTIHSANYPSLIAELKATKARIGNIFAVAPIGARTAALDDALGDHIRYCSPGCITTNLSGTMHSKFAVFTAATDPGGTRRSNVSWISSSNLNDSTGYHDYNDAFSVYGDTTTYNKLVEIWQHMWNGSVRTTDYYAPPRGFATGPNGTLWEGPELNSDLLASQLALVTPRPNCVIRIVNQEFAGRGAVVDQLRRLRANGNCFVRIVISRISPTMCTQLRNGAVDDLRQLSGRVHNKMLLVDDGDGATYRVFTGSQNLTTSGNEQNDDLLFRLANHKPYFDKYLEHFGVIYTEARASSTVLNWDGVSC